MKRTPPQTGDTQAICIDKPSNFIDWCIDVTDSALDQQAANVRDTDHVPAKAKSRPKRRKAA